MAETTPRLELPTLEFACDDPVWFGFFKGWMLQGSSTFRMSAQGSKRKGDGSCY